MKKIIHGTIFTMTGEVIRDGAVLFDTKIRKLGTTTELEQDPAEELDVQGAYVYPGLIDAHSHLGMFEDSLGFEGDDGNEDSDPITPHLRAIDAINPFDRCFSDARSAGITTVLTGPGSANPISGQFAAIKTAGICIDDMIVKAPAAMKFALGENPKSVYHSKNQSPVTRMGTAAMIREALYKAKEYQTALRDYEENPEEHDKPEYDIKMESLLDVLDRKIPVKIHAHRADDICTAIRLGKEFSLWITIEHATDAAAVADILKREKIPVQLGPTLTDRSKPELKNQSYKTYQLLSDLGISVSIITDHPEIPVEHLPLCAALAVKNGMNPEKAMEALTVTAAKNCGIEAIVGSIQPGKDADFAVFSKNPLELDCKTLCTIIRGEIVFQKLPSLRCH